MKGWLLAAVDRRSLFRFAFASIAAATTGSLTTEAAAAEPAGNADKRKARYQANTGEVQNFYRVNSYPAR